MAIPCRSLDALQQQRKLLLLLLLLLLMLLPLLLPAAGCCCCCDMLCHIPLDPGRAPYPWILPCKKKAHSGVMPRVSK